MNEHELIQAYAAACGAAQEYIQALEEELGHQGVGGGDNVKTLSKKWEDAQMGIYRAHQP